MEGASKGIEVSKTARDRLKAPPLHCSNERFFALLDDHSLFIEHQDIHVYPFASHIETMIVGNARLRSLQRVPSSEYSRQFKHPLGIDQHLSRSQRHKCRVDVHWVRICELDDLNRILLGDIQSERFYSSVVDVGCAW